MVPSPRTSSTWAKEKFEIFLSPWLDEPSHQTSDTHNSAHDNIHTHDASSNVGYSDAKKSSRKNRKSATLNIDIEIL